MSTDSVKLAELLFPDVDKTQEQIEKAYPPRNLKEGAKVTRFAPSPTGFIHFGGLFPSTVSERLAHQSGGVFYLRIEDTDAKREVAGAKDALIETLSYYGIKFDEGASENGEVGSYGPYTQSLRRDIYRVYAKKLTAEGKAYPVFLTAEEYQKLNAVDKKAELKARDWHADSDKQLQEQLAARSITYEQAKQRLEHGDIFVLRMRATGDPDKKFKFNDLVKGLLELPENDRDEIILKSDGMPSYHFAHVVDDHLMGTTHVIRGDEWLSSLPRHIMLFDMLGFKPPKYAHISPIMRIDENGNKKKLSKRDMGANLEDYRKLGYAPECVTEYIMTLLNSNYEEWRMQNPDKEYTSFPFSLKKMSPSGCLFDPDKLNDVSKNVLSRFSADRIYQGACEWAKEFDAELFKALSRDPEYSIAVFSIGRGGKKPRKDIAKWDEIRAYAGFFYDELFKPKYDFPSDINPEDVRKILDSYTQIYDKADDESAWFDKIKKLAERLGFASDMRQYKQNPEQFKGSVADVAMVLRVAVTGKTMSPDTYRVMQILGPDRINERITRAKGAL